MAAHTAFASDCDRSDQLLMQANGRGCACVQTDVYPPQAKPVSFLQRVRSDDPETLRRNQQRMDGSFVDPKVEGTFTSDSRAKIHKYIQERIKSHESIIRYYKRRQNALTVTCRIPSEVLASIFSQVAKDAVEDYGSTYPKEMHWISTISHICSHWREVSLSTPTLWSTINVEYPLWALAILRRSKSVPLSVVNPGVISNHAYHVLLKILASQLSRIQGLFLGYRNQYLVNSGYEITSISLGEYRALLQLLGQHDFTCMERFELKSPITPFPTTNDPVQLQLPERIITQSASLRHLALDGHGMNWGLSPAFKGLKSFEISRIPVNFQPSMAQLLRFLSRVPLLESLSLDIHPGVSRSNVEHVHMGYLKGLRISCGSLAVINSFFDYLTFPKGGIISTHFIDISSVDEPFTAALQHLAQRLDDLTDGPILELSLGSLTVICWKAKQMGLDGGPPTIVIVSSLALHVAGVILRFLRLDQLKYLAVVDYSRFFDDANVWSSIGNLPQLAELKVNGYEEAVITALSSNLKAPTKQRWKLRAKKTTLHPAFRALTNLTIDNWDLGRIWANSTTGEKLLDCVKLREKAKLRLKRLEIQSQCSVEGTNLINLRELIDEVKSCDNIGQR